MSADPGLPAVSDPASHRHPGALAGIASATLAVALMAGCASVTPGTPDGLTSVPMGTVTAYHRKSSGSLGTFDGQVVWTHAPGTWQGRQVIAFGAPQAGVSLHDPVTFAVVALTRPDGQPVMSYDPPIAYDWPLVVGKTWESRHTALMAATGQKVDLRYRWRVAAVEDVTVPAGTFRAYRLEWSDNHGESEVRWIDPGAGIAAVKRHVERPASHPLGAGVLDAELLSVQRPKP